MTGGLRNSLFLFAIVYKFNIYKFEIREVINMSMAKRQAARLYDLQSYPGDDSWESLEDEDQEYFIREAKALNDFEEDE
ncbi:hypothetical protein [Cronobacter turicensis]|uniref:hypothetical protein n=1 Tax=Cronobacter turicensis TaxID=413502 RepID=UPI0024C3930A|nr:hypothetical protein [Cronobacter turicensis]